MQLRRLIKKNAMLALRMHWCRAAAVSLIVLLFWAAFSTMENIATVAFKVPPFVDGTSPDISLDNLPNTSPIALALMIFIGILSFFITAPLKLGATRWYYYLTDGIALTTVEIFDYFFSVRKYFGALFIEVILFFKKLFWSVLFLAPPAAMVFMGNYWRQQASRNIEILISTGIEILGGALLVLLGWFWLMWMRRYSLARFIFVSDGAVSARNAVKRSVLFTKGRLLEFLMLEFSLIGWRIADIMIVPRLFTVPYINTVYSLYARYLTELNAHIQREQQCCGEESENTEQEPSPEKEEDIETNAKDIASE